MWFSSAFLLVLAAAVALVEGLYVEVPCCSEFPHLGATFGPRLPFFSPGVRSVLTRSVSPEDCAGGEAGKVVMVDRSDHVQFADLVRACQAKGVSGVVVKNHGDELVRMGAVDGHGITTPSVFISKRAGDELDEHLAAQGEEVVVQLFEADDLGYLYGALFLIFPVFLLGLLASLAVVGLVRLCAPRADAGWNSELAQPLVVVVAANGESLDSLEQQQPVGVTQEEKLLPVVLPSGGNQKPVSLTLVNGEPLFDQQAQ